jgi:cobyrinic acid a,c-diamide synthase
MVTPSTGAPLPRVVIAAASSGSGKTTVATGLVAALHRRGLAVSPHKVGPDYIDPGYHALACGRPGRNLDPWLVGPERIVPLLRHGAATPSVSVAASSVAASSAAAPPLADVAVVEGVMGLYDGASPRPGLDPGFASTAHVARLTGSPVIVVLDTRSQARTAAAVVLGLRAFDPGVRIGGVILNRVGSGNHETLLCGAMAEIGVPVLGVVRRREELAAPSRHLGLVPVAERAAASVAVVDALAEAVGEGVDLDAVLALARTAPPLTEPAWDAVREVGGPLSTGDGPLVAVAAGPAFTFGYAETGELLAAAGARVTGFDPLRDAALPPGTQGLVIGGGFPEVYAEALSANGSLRAELAAFDGPVLAECAGLLYLGESLDGAPMVGRLPVRARMTNRLTLGYREAVSASPSCVGAVGETVRGHEFHKTATDPRCGADPAWRWDGVGHGFVEGPGGRVNASYLHTHWAGHPSSARRFVAACLGATAEAAA